MRAIRYGGYEGSTGINLRGGRNPLCVQLDMELIIFLVWLAGESGRNPLCVQLDMENEANTSGAKKAEKSQSAMRAIRYGDSEGKEVKLQDAVAIRYACN